MKAMLIINMPKSCDECMLCDTHEITENGYDYANCYALHQDIKAKFDSDGRFMIKKPNHCPLKPMPQKKKDEYDNHILDNNDCSWTEQDYECGYNQCIDEILGEDNAQDNS